MIVFHPIPTPILLWNNILESKIAQMPFSFNPSLFFFYQKQFDWKPYYIFINQGDSIAGLLPLVNTGKAWVSLPHFSYGGLMEIEKKVNNKSELIRNIITEISNQELDAGFYAINNKEVGQQKEELSISHFIRSMDNQEDEEFIRSEKVTMLLELDTNADDLFNKLSSNLRRKIRKAKTHGFEIKTGGIELLNDFHKVYTNNILNLKSIGYNKQFFKDLFSVWQYGNIKFFVAYNNDKPVGAALLVSYQGFFENLYFATLPDFRKNYISDLLHWQMITYSFSKLDNKTVHKKPAIYSFGRSTELSSVFNYKQHWPVTTLPLYVYSNLNDVRQNVSLNKIWQNIHPKITKPFWPILIKHIY